MTTDVGERLATLGLPQPPASTVQEVFAAVWMASCAHKHMWSWPYRTGEGLENVFHIHWTDSEPTVVLTALTINADWLMLHGARATPVRTLMLSDAAGWEFIDNVSRAMHEDTVRVWTWFGDWWLGFREQHSVLHPPVDLSVL